MKTEFCKWIFVLSVILLTSCDGLSESSENGSGEIKSDLDSAAIEAGIIADPETLDLEGYYAAGEGASADRFCAIKTPENYDVGLIVSYGESQFCKGVGQASLDGENVQLTLKGTEKTADPTGDTKCTISAIFDGTELTLSGSIPEECAKLCRRRASIAGTAIPLVEQGPEAALRAKGMEQEILCDSQP